MNEELAYIANEAMLRRNHVRKRICIELRTMHIKWANEQCSHTLKKEGNKQKFWECEAKLRSLRINNVEPN